MQSAVGMVWGVNVLWPYSHSAVAIAIVGRAREPCDKKSNCSALQHEFTVSALLNFRIDCV